MDERAFTFSNVGATYDTISQYASDEIVGVQAAAMLGAGLLFGGVGKKAVGTLFKYAVGPYNKLKGKIPGYDAHHVGQKALMQKFIPGYDSNTAPSILVPRLGHTKGQGVLSRKTSGFSNARQVVARDIMELRRVYPDIPNSQLQKLIEMNKNMYPEAFIK